MVGLKRDDERVELRTNAGNFHEDGTSRHVDNLRSKNIGKFNDPGTLCRRDLDADERKLAFNVGDVREILRFDDGYKLLKLATDLFRKLWLNVEDDGHAGEGRIFCGANSETVDIVAARREHPGNVGEHAWNVLDAN